MKIRSYISQEVTFFIDSYESVLNPNKFCFRFSTVIAPPNGHFLKHAGIIITYMRMKFPQLLIFYCNMLRALATPGSRAGTMH